VDDNYFLINIEERIRVLRLRIFGVLADWEVAPFVDIGRVFSGFNQLLTHVQVNPGFGVRALVKPNVVGRFDAGFGPEGMTLFVGLGFPF
jgi:hemolysin activation/secretion protein